jgi:hypothetical protein
LKGNVFFAALREKSRCQTPLLNLVISNRSSAKSRGEGAKFSSSFPACQADLSRCSFSEGGSLGVDGFWFLLQTLLFARHQTLQFNPVNPVDPVKKDSG